MKRTIKQRLKHLTKDEYLILKELTHEAKNIVNEAIYLKRQHFFNTGLYLDDKMTRKQMEDNPSYRILNSNMSQQIIKKVDLMFKSFFGLLKAKKSGKVSSDRKIHMPRYLDKNGYYTLIIQEVPKFENNKYYVPYTWKFSKTHKRIAIKLPLTLVNKKDMIKEIRIVPRYNAKFFEVHYVYNIEETQPQINFDLSKVLAIDLGINNFATCVTTEGKSFIIDGKKMKSYNQWYNKRNAILSGIKDKQKFGNDLTKQQICLTLKRNNRILDYISKASKYIINYCISNKIGTIILGYREDFQDKFNIGVKNNQIFGYTPFGQFKFKLEYLCDEVGISLIIQEESYTSKASFLDNDDIPIYDKNNLLEYSFSGRRIKRGLYKSAKGILINADVNAAFNILRKSKIVPNEIVRLYSSGALSTPVRIRLHQ